VCVSADSSSFIAAGTRKVDKGIDLLISDDGLSWNMLLKDVPSGRRVVNKGRMMVVFSSDGTYRIDFGSGNSSASMTRLCDSDGADSGTNGMSCFANDLLVTIRKRGELLYSKDSGCTFTGPVRDPLLDYMRRPATDTTVDPFEQTRYSGQMFSIGSYVFIATKPAGVLDLIFKGKVLSGTTSVDEVIDIYTNPPYPNPANQSTAIRVAWFLTVPPATISLKIYDQIGQEVRDLSADLRRNVEGHASTVTLYVSDLPNGIYYAVSRAVGQTSTQQIVVQR
ncbi:MAG: Secretion system C-terminal sorting domain, partial [Bacteroidota bacterium]